MVDCRRGLATIERRATCALARVKTAFLKQPDHCLNNDQDHSKIMACRGEFL
jgi:hypothetical protein